MAYSVNYTNPSKTQILIEDQTADNTTSLTLLGKQYDQYGEIIAENFLKLLENFSYSTAPSNPTPGQLWHDPSSKILNVYDAAGVWKPLSVVYTSTTAPTTNAAQANGDLWTNTVTGEIFVYSGSEWVELAAQTQTSGIRSTTRVDNAETPQTHYTIEAVNNTQTVFVISTEDGWTPASSELLADNTVMNLSFPILYKGINFNYIDPYGVHNLSTTRINVGRSTTGHVVLENNQNDATDDITGAGVTLRTTENPVNGSIFSVRSSDNSNRLWVGQSATTVGVNDFCVGFTGDIGNEYNKSLYNINLALDGSISAKTATGIWVATNSETIGGTISNKIVTPAGARAAIDARTSQLISSDSLLRATSIEAATIGTTVNDKVMTPVRTAEAITALVPSMIPPGIGVNQTWQIMTNRTWSTDYTNTTNRAIQVSVYLYGPNRTVDCKLYINGIMVQRFYGNPDSADIAFTLSGIVPVGAVYQVQQTGFSSHQWNELR